MNNLLLAGLPWDAYEQLRPLLEPWVLERGRTFHEAGAPERHVYFITSGIVGKSYVLRNGDSATFALTGREGAVGIDLLLGAEAAPSRSTVVTAGTAWRLPAEQAKAAFGRNGALQRILLRYTQALMAQTAQTAVCNQHHSLEQRLCRLLLSCLDRLPSTDLALTQQAAADILGVRRESVTEAAGRLEQRGLTHSGRGHVVVLDRAGVQANACECYVAVKREYERSAPAPLLQLPETCGG